MCLAVGAQWFQVLPCLPCCQQSMRPSTWEFKGRSWDCFSAACWRSQNSASHGAIAVLEIPQPDLRAAMSLWTPGQRYTAGCSRSPNPSPLSARTKAQPGTDSWGHHLWIAWHQAKWLQPYLSLSSLWVLLNRQWNLPGLWQHGTAGLC